MSVDVITIPKLVDLHAHLRQGPMLKHVVRQMRGQGYECVLAMPNTDPIIETASDVVRYRDDIMACEPDFTPLLAIYLTHRTTPQTIREAKRAGAAAVKYYPRKRDAAASNVTTNSGHGLHPDDLLRKRDVLMAIEEENLVFCLHGEHPDATAELAETAFLHYLHMLAIRYPDMKIVLEHVSTAVGVSVVKTYENVYATVTVHHLALTNREVNGNPFHLCKPIAKEPEDLEAIWEAVVSGKSHFFLGTDSAPHPRRTKERAGGPSYGVYTSYAAPLLATLLERRDALNKLTGFSSMFGAACYGLRHSGATVTLKRDPCAIPDEPDPELPRQFWAGEAIPWRIHPAP